MTALPIMTLDVPTSEARRRLRVVPEPRPRTRGDCAAGPRPCPWVTCRYHLAVDVTATSARVIRPETEEGLVVGESCALDVAERGGIRQEDVAELLDLSIESIRQTEIAARAGIRLAGGPLLRQVYDEGGVEDERGADLELVGESAAMFWSEEPDHAAIEAQELEEWSGRVTALMAVGLRLRAACESARRWDGTALDAVEEADMTRTEPELRKTIADRLDAGPAKAMDLALELDEPRERVASVLAVLQDAGRAHVVRKGPATQWHAGPAPAVEAKPAKAPAKKKAKVTITRTDFSIPQSMPQSHPTLAAGFGLNGVREDMLERLLALPLEAVLAIDRIMARRVP